MKRFDKQFLVILSQKFREIKFLLKNFLLYSIWRKKLHSREFFIFSHAAVAQCVEKY